MPRYYSGQRRGYGNMIGSGKYSAIRGFNKFAKTKGGKAVGNLGIALLKSATKRVMGAGLYTGQGSYSKNSLIGRGVAPEVPLFASQADETGAVTVSRREFVADLYAPGLSGGQIIPFENRTFALNPGLEQVFPWLSQIAQNYDEYEFKQLIFTFRSTTTDIGSSTTGQCGTVIMATNYNPANPNFADKNQMMEYDAAMSSKITESLQHGVECDTRKLAGDKIKHIRANPTGSVGDLKDYDHGNFQIAIANAPKEYANQTIGELWVSYTVVLRKPKFFTSRGLGITKSMYLWNSTNDPLMAGTEGHKYPFGQLKTISGQQNSLNCSLSLFDSTAAGVKQLRILFPASYSGTLEIVMQVKAINVTSTWVVSDFGTSYNPLLKSGNVTEIRDLYGGGAPDAPAPYTPSYALLVDENVTTDTNPQHASLRMHFRVTSASGGIENGIIINVDTKQSAALNTNVLFTTLEIFEYNAGFSYKSNNVGPPGLQSDAPILVDSNGTIVNI